ncbi:MAG: hypothetical protein HUJ30_01265 [Gammaproteobacteria bacterium]|nr:hypothetical protein [Gammaproteobacteria bacterium]
MDLQQTRQENINRLTPHLEEIQHCHMLDALEPFAKAYLGLYYQLDNDVPPLGRIAQLSDDALYQAILRGFHTLLDGEYIPLPGAIGSRFSEDHDLGTGYILLAALQHYCQDHPERILKLSEPVISAAACYSYAHGAYQENRWLDVIIHQRPQLLVNALLDFWRPIYQKNQELLPGLTVFLRNKDTTHISRQLAKTLLLEWPDCDTYTLYRLLQLVITSDDPVWLTEVLKTRIEQCPTYDIQRKIYWLTSAFFLQPERYYQQLALYIGRTKEKVIKLLDFSYAALSQTGMHHYFSAMELAQLLRLIAPVIVRNKGRLGQLDQSSTKVLNLFEQLASYPQHERQQAVQWLHQVRVMRSYADILEQLQ